MSGPAIDLAAERLGGCAIEASDEFFGPKEALVRAGPPEARLDADADAEAGRWVDGWQTRRRRVPGHDWCVVALGVAGNVEKVIIDTTHFTGGFPEWASVDGADVDGVPSDDDWFELLGVRDLAADVANEFDVSVRSRVTHVRLNVHPDGGVARLRVLGAPLVDWASVKGPVVDLAAASHGARLVAASDAHYSQPDQLLLPGPSRGVSDGWETARRRGPGHDWADIDLAVPGTVRTVVVDTSHFTGDAPASVRLTGRLLSDGSEVELLGLTRVQPDSVQEFAAEEHGLVDRVVFEIHPDGGVARLRIMGVPDPHHLAQQMMGVLNSLPAKAADGRFRACCASNLWVDGMVEARPFHTVEDVAAASNALWARMKVPDWEEAFAAHPRLGERAGRQNYRGEAWSQLEQLGLASSEDEVKTRLAEANAEYERRFGRTYVVFASGRDGRQLLELLERRLSNDPATELRTSAAEQVKITTARLRKLLALDLQS